MLGDNVHSIREYGPYTLAPINRFIEMKWESGSEQRLTLQCPRVSRYRSRVAILCLGFNSSMSSVSEQMEIDERLDDWSRAGEGIYEEALSALVGPRQNRNGQCYI